MQSKILMQQLSKAATQLVKIRDIPVYVSFSPDGALNPRSGKFNRQIDLHTNTGVQI